MPSLSAAGGLCADPGLCVAVRRATFILPVGAGVVLLRLWRRLFQCCTAQSDLLPRSRSLLDTLLFLACTFTPTLFSFSQPLYFGTHEPLPGCWHRFRRSKKIQDKNIFCQGSIMSSAPRLVSLWSVFEADWPPPYAARQDSLITADGGGNIRPASPVPLPAAR